MPVGVQLTALAVSVLFCLFVGVAMPALGAPLALPTALRSNTDAISTEFAAFKRAHGKVYASASEEARREQMFRENYLFITRHNLEKEHGKHSYTVDVNQFADLSWSEFAALHLAKQPLLPGTAHGAPQPSTPLLPEVALATIEAHDWRAQGVVPPVQDQGRAATGWAHAAVAAIESASAIASGVQTPLSVQQLVDCSLAKVIPSLAAQSPHVAALLFATKHGIAARETERQGPTTVNASHAGHPSPLCRLTTPPAASVASVLGVHASEPQLRAAVTQQPVAVALRVAGPAMQFYRDGVFDGSCGSAKNTHAMLVVGYGTAAEGTPYWIVQNSWGTSWGREGHLLLARYNAPAKGVQTERDERCGIYHAAVYPTMPGPHYQRPRRPAVSAGGNGTNATGCLPDETRLDLSSTIHPSRSGWVCAPRCSPVSHACSTDVPPGTSASSPRCMLTSAGTVSRTSTDASYCALSCDPLLDVRADAQCPVGATCARVRDSDAHRGLCVFT